VDPTFTGPIDACRLGRLSACIDAGNNVSWLYYTFDVYGKARWIDGLFDIGAVEFGKVANDYDFDGRSDLAVCFTSGGLSWYSTAAMGAGTTLYGTNWGTAGCIPVPIDYNGDGQTEVTYYRPSTGTWSGGRGGTSP